MCGPRPVSFVACAKFLEFLTTFPRTHTRMVHIYIHNLSPERHGVRVRWRSEKKRARAEALVVCVCEYARIRNTPQKVVVSAKCAFFGLSRLFCSLLSRFKTCRTCFLSFFCENIKTGKFFFETAGREKRASCVVVPVLAFFTLTIFFTHFAFLTVF